MPIISNALISKFKKKAKADYKSSPYSLAQFQDEIAREHGYLNWRTFISFEGRGAVSKGYAHKWFKQNFTRLRSPTKSLQLLNNSEQIFNTIAKKFDFALDYAKGGRLVKLSHELANNSPFGYLPKTDTSSQPYIGRKPTASDLKPGRTYILVGASISTQVVDELTSHLSPEDFIGAPHCNTMLEVYRLTDAERLSQVGYEVFSVPYPLLREVSNVFSIKPE